MANYHPGSTLRQHRLRDLFLPSKLVWLLYGLISVLLLIIMNVTAIVEVFAVEPVTTKDIVPLTDKFSEFQDKLSTPVVMAFWLVVGAVTYTIIWLTENVFFIAKTQVAESQYVARNPTARQKYWESAITSNLFLVFMILLWLSFIALYLRQLLPVFSSLFHSGLYSAPVDKRFLNIVGAILGNVVAIYLILLGRRLITAAWHATRP